LGDNTNKYVVSLISVFIAGLIVLIGLMALSGVYAQIEERQSEKRYQAVSTQLGIPKAEILITPSAHDGIYTVKANNRLYLVEFDTSDKKIAHMTEERTN